MNDNTASLVNDHLSNSTVIIVLHVNAALLLLLFNSTISSLNGDLIQRIYKNAHSHSYTYTYSSTMRLIQLNYPVWTNNNRRKLSLIEKNFWSFDYVANIIERRILQLEFGNGNLSTRKYELRKIVWAKLESLSNMNRFALLFQYFLQK